ncbi:MAG: DUF4115 domain-containing protein, partial [Candidatus Omnitrophica bacterium]|nr:DUF4115 domain-containing protein [Candidatus Omnitrophota bacterium]
MESSGARLKKIRLEKGLSLEEAHKKTKIHLNILKAIEEDNFIGLNPIYIKGFLKIYCRFLGVDAKDYIAGYQEPQGTAKIMKEFSSAPKQGPPFFQAVLEKLSFLRRINIKAILVIIVVLFLFLGLFKLGRIIASKRIRRVRVPAVKIEKAKTVAVKEQHAEPAQPKVKTAALAQIVLSLRAKEDCWVHLAVDGKVVFHSILRRGKFETWQAKDKMELSLGNAGVIELELNGKIIPPLGRRGQVLKNIVINKKVGLVVV